jgi:hypothetical protein
MVFRLDGGILLGLVIHILEDLLVIFPRIVTSHLSPSRHPASAAKSGKGRKRKRSARITSNLWPIKANVRSAKFEAVFCSILTEAFRMLQVSEEYGKEAAVKFVERLGYFAAMIVRS